jgi:hypothetical protein
MTKDPPTFCGVTGLYAGIRNTMLTNAVHTTAHRLINTLALPKCHGPLSNRPYANLQTIGMQYDQSYATAQILKIADIVM